MLCGQLTRQYLAALKSNFSLYSNERISMSISKTHHIHRINYGVKKPRPRQARETRATLGARFKILLLDAGLSCEQAAKILHVTPRTVQYWISGKVMVPYAACPLNRGGLFQTWICWVF
jgi:DNA-binding transcriptional regulator YiaG